MKARLDHDGVKVLLDPEELNLAKQFGPRFTQWVETSIAWILRALIAGEALGPEKLAQIANERGLGPDSSPEEYARFAADVVGEHVLKRFAKKFQPSE